MKSLYILVALAAAGYQSNTLYLLVESMLTMLLPVAVIGLVVAAIKAGAQWHIESKRARAIAEYEVSL